MRTADIKVGEEYAVARRGRDEANPDRVRVLAFGMPRRVFNDGRDYHGHIVRNGISVRMLDVKTGEWLMSPFGTQADVPRPWVDTVIARNFVRTWAEQEVINARIDERDAHRSAKLAAARSEVANAFSIAKIAVPELNIRVTTQQFGEALDVTLSAEDFTSLIAYYGNALRK